jgi:hypothetical protein
MSKGKKKKSEYETVFEREQKQNLKKGNYTGLQVAILILFEALIGYGAFISFLSIDFVYSNIVLIPNGFEIIYNAKTIMYLIYVAIWISIMIVFSLLRMMNGKVKEEETKGRAGFGSNIFNLIVIIIILTLGGFTFIFQVFWWFLYIGTWIVFIGASIAFIGVLIFIIWSAIMGIKPKSFP